MKIYMEWLLRKYRELSAPVKATMWFTVSSVIQKGIVLLLTPVFTRLMSTEQYGIYSVYQSWYFIISIFATLNLSAGVYNNGMTKWPDERKTYTSSLLGLSTLITGILLCIYLINTDFWNGIFGLGTVYVIAIFAEAFFAPAFNFWAAGERYDYRYRNLVSVSVFMGIATPVLGVIAVLGTEYKAEARVLSYVAVQVAVGMILYITLVHRGKKLFDRKYWKFALNFNVPLIPHYLSQTVLNQADRIMISNMVGNSEAAIYSVAYMISMMFTILTTAVNNSFVPYTYKALRDKQYSPLRKNSSFLVLMIALTCTVAIIIGPELIWIFAAPEYYEARWVVPPVAESVLFMFIYPLFCNVEFYYEKTKFIMVASSIAAVANVILNFVGIRMFGYHAAAYTTLICYMVLSSVHYFAYKRICKERGIPTDIYSLKIILIISVLSLMFMALITLVYDNTIIRYGILIVAIIVIVARRKAIVERVRGFKEG